MGFCSGFGNIEFPFISESCIMAKITQALTRASKEYDPIVFQSLVRDLDGVINKQYSSRHINT